MQFTPRGDYRTRWGESPRWDAVRQRLYFVDCAASRLCWLDAGGTMPESLKLPGMATAVVLTRGNDVLTVQEDGIYQVNPDSGSIAKFVDNPAPSPEPRLNDAQADRNGNLITGSLGYSHDPVGSYWHLSKTGTWRRLDTGVSDANGPVASLDNRTLFLVDTGEMAVFSYEYDATTGQVGDRKTLVDTTGQPGLHDGAALDADGNYWSAMTHGGSCLLCISPGGEILRRVDVPVDFPTAISFGGEKLDRAYVTSVSIEFAGQKPQAELAGAILEISGLGVTGAPEPRFDL